MYGDSYFHLSADSQGPAGAWNILLRNAQNSFCRKYLQSLAWNDDATRGETRTVQHTVNIKGVQKIIFGHARNEPGTVGLPKKILCGSAHLVH